MHYLRLVLGALLVHTLLERARVFAIGLETRVLRRVQLRLQVRGGRRLGVWRGGEGAAAAGAGCGCGRG